MESVHAGSHMRADFWDRISNLTESPPAEVPIIEANAGPDLIIEAGALATLNGSNSITHSQTAAYVWQQISGETTTVYNPDRPVATVQTGKEGEMIFELTLSIDGVEDKDSMRIEVIAPARKGCSQMPARPEWLLGLGAVLVALRRRPRKDHSCPPFSAINAES